MEYINPITLLKGESRERWDKLFVKEKYFLKDDVEESIFEELLEEAKYYLDNRYKPPSKYYLRDLIIMKSGIKKDEAMDFVKRVYKKLMCQIFNNLSILTEIDGVFIFNEVVDRIKQKDVNTPIYEIISDMLNITETTAKIYEPYYCKYLGIKSSYKVRREKEIKNIDNPECPFCGSINIIKQGRRENKNNIKQRYKCKDCSKKFVKEAQIDAKRTYPINLVFSALDYYFSGHSLRETKGILKQRYGLDVDHTTILMWRKNYVKFEISDNRRLISYTAFTM